MVYTFLLLFEQIFKTYDDNKIADFYGFVKIPVAIPLNPFIKGEWIDPTANVYGGTGFMRIPIDLNNYAQT